MCRGTEGGGGYEEFLGYRKSPVVRAGESYGRVWGEGKGEEYFGRVRGEGGRERIGSVRGSG